MNRDSAVALRHTLHATRNTPRDLLRTLPGAPAKARTELLRGPSRIDSGSTVATDAFLAGGTHGLRWAPVQDF